MAIPLKIIDSQNDFNILVAKQWKFRNSVPIEPEWDLKGALNGAFKGTLKGKFERQPSLVNLRGESGAHEAPYVALLIWNIQMGPGESPGASDTAAPLDIR